MWHYTVEGSGRPLVLLHGIGMSRTAWSAVIPQLSATRRVIAFDIPGFGHTPPSAAGLTPTPGQLAKGLVACLEQMGVATPVDLIGNSLGGRLALEAAKQGVARSVVAISPGELWSGHARVHARAMFAALRLGARALPGIGGALLKLPLMREMLLAVPLSAGSRRMSSQDAIRAMEDFGGASGFTTTLSNTGIFTNGQSISCPVTIAYGTRDWVLTNPWRRRDALPQHTSWVHPPGWGHVPMWTDPAGVARLILEGTK